MSLDLTDQQEVRTVADRIAQHIAEDDGGKHFHINGFLKPMGDEPPIVDLKSMGVDVDALGLKKITHFNYDHYMDLPDEVKTQIKQAISDHVVETLNDPNTKFHVANGDGSKFYFGNSETGTRIAFDANVPHGGTIVRTTTPSKFRSGFLRDYVKHIGPEGKDLSVGPEGKAGGLPGALDHYEAETGKKPHVTGPVDDYKPNAPGATTPTTPDIDPDAPEVDVDIKPDAPKVDLDVEIKPGAATDMLENVGKRTGPIIGAVIGVAVGGITLIRGGTVAEAAEVTVEVAVPYGETGLDLAKGDLEAAERSGAIETGSTLGGWGGAVGGAAAGAAIGSVVPIVGTAIGGVVGGVIGSVGGGFAGSAISERLYDAGDETARNEERKAEQAAPGLIREPDAQAPHLQDYKQVSMPAAKGAAIKHMGIDVNTYNNMDFTDPSNLAALEDAIAKEIEAQNVIKDKNDTWFWGGDSFKVDEADARIQSLQSAQIEIGMFKDALAKSCDMRDISQTTHDIVAEGTIGTKGMLAAQFDSAHTPKEAPNLENSNDLDALDGDLDNLGPITPPVKYSV